MDVFSIYIKHPPTMTADTLLELLQVCGPLLRWKPMMDPSTNQARNFGFAEYSDMQTVARVTRLLTTLPLSPWMVNVDKATRARLDVFNNSLEVDKTSDAQVYAKIHSMIRAFLGPADNPAANMDTEMTPAADDFLNSLSLPMAGASASQQIGAESAIAQEFDDVEQLQKLERDRQLELEKMYIERLRKWESREAYRRRLRREAEDRDEKPLLPAGEMSEFLASYDDDEEEKIERDNWFYDRDEWICKRRPIRDRELDFDRQEINRKSRAHSRTTSHESSRRASISASKEPDVMSAKELKSRLGLLLDQRLQFLKPGNMAPDSDILKYRISWHLLSKKAVDRSLVPILENRIEQFLGQKDAELVEFLTETIVPADVLSGKSTFSSKLVSKDPREILEEIYAAFGETDDDRKEATSIVAAAWKCIAWETEKNAIVQGRAVSGLEGELEDLKVENCAFIKH